MILKPEDRYNAKVLIRMAQRWDAYNAKTPESAKLCKATARDYRARAKRFVAARV